MSVNVVVDVFLGKYTSSSVEEEEMCQDLFLFMQLLTNLIARDFLDFSESGKLTLAVSMS